MAYLSDIDYLHLSVRKHVTQWIKSCLSVRTMWGSFLVWVIQRNEAMNQIDDKEYLRMHSSPVKFKKIQTNILPIAGMSQVVWHTISVLDKRNLICDGHDGYANVAETNNVCLYPHTAWVTLFVCFGHTEKREHQLIVKTNSTCIYTNHLLNSKFFRQNSFCIAGMTQVLWPTISVLYKSHT